jgi:CTP synthase
LRLNKIMLLSKKDMATTHTLFITGGIVSGLGKGITSASLGALLKARGFSVMPQKMDPYLNVDAGTMNPFQHGEVFVTDDGAETDLDLGHYERFLDVAITKLSNFTTGSIYQSVTEQERNGTYLGKTIQVVPHVTDEIQRRIELLKEKFKPDFQIVEVGGTVGDIEALPYLESVRQYATKNKRTTLFIHVVKMDYIYPSDEAKTKPIQQSVSLLRSFGITPDILVVRAKRPISDEVKEKIALFCGVTEKQIIAALDAPSLYHIPLFMEKEGLAKVVLSLMGRKQVKPDLAVLKEIAKRTNISDPVIRVGLVGKYTDLSDAYLSVIEAAKHAGFACNVKVEIVPIDSEKISLTLLKSVNAIIVPGGFGSRGIEGKIKAIKWARENRMPFLGICLGLQCAVIDIARHLANLEDSTSEEFNPKSTNPVIAFLPDQAAITRKGGTMRLGSFEAILNPLSRISKLYAWGGEKEKIDFPLLKDLDLLTGNKRSYERHRHRYEVNPQYHKALVKTGLIFSGMSPDGTLVEYIELPSEMHPYFVATQAHPEFKSRPQKAHPLFAGLVQAAKEQHYLLDQQNHESATILITEKQLINKTPS